MPAINLLPFYVGAFDPLTAEEIEILWLFRNLWKNNKLLNSYIIATSKEAINLQLVIEHETSHALWCLHSDYEKDAQKIIKKFNTKLVEKKLLEIGYAKNVLADELTAYSISGSSKFDLPKKMQKAVQCLFADYCIKYNLHLDKNDLIKNVII